MCDKEADRLSVYLQVNFTPGNYLFDNIVKYVAAQGYGFDEKVDILEMLLNGTGINRREIESFFLDEEITEVPAESPRF